MKKRVSDSIHAETSTRMFVAEGGRSYTLFHFPIVQGLVNYVGFLKKPVLSITLLQIKKLINSQI